MHLEPDSDTRKLIIFDLFLLLFIIGTAVSFTILNEYVNEQTIEQMTLTKIQASTVIGFFIGLASIYYLYKLYKKFASKFIKEY